MKVLRSLSAVLILAVMLGGCANHTVVTALPPGVTQTQVNAWTTAVNDLKTISDATHAIQVGVITANRNGLFPDGNAYAATVTAIGRADALELQATQFLQSVPNNFGQPIQTQLMNFTTQIISQLQSASGQLGIPVNIATQIAAIIATGLQLEQLIQSLTAKNDCVAIFTTNPPTCAFASESR